MILFVTAALAQDRVLWDFDATFPVYDFRLYAIGSPEVATPAAPWAGDALEVGLWPAGAFPEVESILTLATPWDGPVVVTHAELAVTARVDGLFPQFVGLFAYDLEGSFAFHGEELPIGEWRELRITDPLPCGAPLQLDVQTMGLGTANDLGVVTYDDFLFSGELCPSFADADGDGLCPEGLDLDANGDCASDEERTVGSVQDCDDDRFGPACLTLAVDAIVPGLDATFTVTGAVPGDTVHLLWSELPGQTCPAQLGGGCVDLHRPRKAGSEVAGPDGVASFVVPVGRNVALSSWAQALVLREGDPADLSPPLELVP